MLNELDSPLRIIFKQVIVASVDGHMADDQVRTSSKVARGTPKWTKMEVIVTRWYVSWSNFWCCCSLSNVVVLSRITTTNRSTVLLLVATA